MAEEHQCRLGGELPRTLQELGGKWAELQHWGGVSRCAWGLRDLAMWLLQLQQLTRPLVFQNDGIPAVSWILPLAFCCLRGKERVSWLPSTTLTSHLVLPQLVLNLQEVTVIM